MRTITHALYVYADGREVCRDTPEGREEYVRRKSVAWCAQRHRCALCDRRLSLRAATVDHIAPRGMGAGRRDDRRENIQAVCWECNSEKGSKRK